MSHARSIETTIARPLTIAAQAPARTNRVSPSDDSASEGPSAFVAAWSSSSAPFKFCSCYVSRVVLLGGVETLCLGSSHSGLLSSPTQRARSAGVAGAASLGGITGGVVASVGAGARQAFQSKTTNPIETANHTPTTI